MSAHERFFCGWGDFYNNNREGYFVNPAIGDLHLTARAVEALGKGVQLTGVQDDIDRQKRKKHPDVGADQW